VVPILKRFDTEPRDVPPRVSQAFVSRWNCGIVAFTIKSDDRLDTFRLVVINLTMKAYTNPYII
jgi:hypothetical protein